MKNLNLIAATTFSLLVSNFATADESLTVDLTYGSDYVFRGIKLGEDTLHPSIEFTSDDFYLGVWGAVPQAGRGFPTNFENEYDIYLGQTHTLDSGIVVDGGVTMYTYQEAEKTLEF